MNCTKINFRQPLKVIFFSLMILMGTIKTFAQEVAADLPAKVVYEADHIYEQSDTKPDFPGGIKNFYYFVGKNYRVPKDDNLKGKVVVKFVVERDGSLSNMKIVRDIGAGTGKEAIRVLKKSPKWIPGEQDGKPVRCQYEIPISIF